MQKTFLFIIVFLFHTFTFAQYSVSKDTLLMGSSFSFTAIHENESTATEAVGDAIMEVVRIENLISSWNPDSETSLINANAGIKPVPISLELFQLIERSIRISEMSNGYFDISFASIDKIWTFNGDTMTMPSAVEVDKSIALIDFQQIILDAENQTVFLAEKGMKIGFGAIGKGYAAMQAKSIMQEYGIENGVINAGGDLIAWGKKSEQENWTIGIANPKDKTESIVHININDMAVVTSGDYEKYVVIDGERYGHIINPRTGYPVQGVLSVTILTQDAEIADAMATTVFVLGEKEGMELINHLAGIEAIIVNNKNEVIYSDKIKPFVIENE